MYFSADDIHAARTQAIDFCHGVSRHCLDGLENYLTLHTEFAKKLLQEGKDHLDGASGEASAVSWIERSEQWRHALLQRHLPSLLAGMVHAGAAQMEQWWGNAGNGSNQAHDLAAHLFNRGLKTAPWETFWLLQGAKTTVDEGFVAADQLTEAAITATELIDEEVKVQLAPATGKKPRRRLAA
ncbi:hypothetical protein DLREEDagrD3_16150 [Denitratisoma sp. agr-D3]